MKINNKTENSGCKSDSSTIQNEDDFNCNSTSSSNILSISKFNAKSQNKNKNKNRQLNKNQTTSDKTLNDFSTIQIANKLLELPETSDLLKTLCTSKINNIKSNNFFNSVNSDLKEMIKTKCLKI